MPDYRYPWPASAIGKEEMAMLYQARESSPTRMTISSLLSRAVRQQYGSNQAGKLVEPITTQPKESQHART